jgi:hypothetical protein
MEFMPMSAPTQSSLLSSICYLIAGSSHLVCGLAQSVEKPSFTSQLLNKENDPVNKMSQLRRMFGSSRISDTETCRVAVKISPIRM